MDRGAKTFHRVAMLFGRFLGFGSSQVSVTLWINILDGRINR